MSCGSYQGGAVSIPSPWLCMFVYITLKTINILKRIYEDFLYEIYNSQPLRKS